MDVSVNGQPMQLPSDATVTTVISQLTGTIPARGIAVAVNAEVIPRSQWKHYRLPAGAKLEVLTAMQGG